jgi:hypothetical protein
MDYFKFFVVNLHLDCMAAKWLQFDLSWASGANAKARW